MRGVAVISNEGLLFGIAREHRRSTHHGISEDGYKSLGDEEIKRFDFEDLSCAPDLLLLSPGWAGWLS
jgi:hypothetical protein